MISEYGGREDAYLDCGMETVNDADVLLALWDGEAAHGKGGTGDVVGYAKSLCKPVIIINAGRLVAQSPIGELTAAGGLEDVFLGLTGDSTHREVPS